MPKKNSKKTEIDITHVSELLSEIINDRSVPKNIRAAAEESKGVLNSEGDIEVRISSAIGFLDDIINDPNMPMYTRTQIWNIVSVLEQMKGET